MNNAQTAIFDVLLRDVVRGSSLALFATFSKKAALRWPDAEISIESGTHRDGTP